MLNDEPSEDPTPATDGASGGSEPPAALVACLLELERHVAGAGWEQPPRLFALVPTNELATVEPHLVGDDPDRSADHLSGVEQDEFDPEPDLLGALTRIMWPEGVAGCAVSLVRSFLPPGTEDEVPDDPMAAERYVQEHPQRQDVRAVGGVLRDGDVHGVARLASHPDDLLAAPDLLPGVIRALSDTFAPVPD